MKGVALVLLGLMWQARIAPEPRHFQFERGVEVAPGASGRVCAALDGTVYAHSAALADIRLFAGSDEVPYAVTTSQAEARSEAARILNLGERGGQVVFDLAMPSRAYSSVDLKLSGQDFLATAKVTGLHSLEARSCCSAGVSLGTFTLFDLTGQRLGRSTELALAESTFPFLHVDLAASAAPGHAGFKATTAMVDGAEVPPSREAQTIYTTVAETAKILQMQDKSVAVFAVPAQVPVERVSFELEPQDKTNFSREVQVTAKALDDPKVSGRPAAFGEDVGGTISRVRMTEDGKEIREETLSLSATLGSNGQSAARVEVAVLNGDDKPLAIRAVRLEMRERKLCFDAPAQPVTMYYGDAKLVPPVYDYSRLFQPADAAQPARLEPEAANPQYVVRVEQKTLTERHPEIVWVGLLAAVFVLGAVAFRSAKRV